VVFVVLVFFAGDEFKWSSGAGVVRMVLGWTGIGYRVSGIRGKWVSGIGGKRVSGIGGKRVSGIGGKWVKRCFFSPGIQMFPNFGTCSRKCSIRKRTNQHYLD